MKKILSLVVILFTVALTSNAEVIDTSPNFEVVYDVGGADASAVAVNTPTVKVNKVYNVTVDSVNYKDVGGSELATTISNNPNFYNSIEDIVIKYITKEILTYNDSVTDKLNVDTSPKTSKRIATNVGKYFSIFS